MEFFDELGKKAQAYAGVAADKAKDLAGAASEKAKTVVGTAKINRAIMMEQRELDKNYKAIGKWFVAEYAQEIPEAVKDVVEAVNASKAKIAEMEAAKEATKDEPVVEVVTAEKTCPICGAKADSKFCPQCGAPMGE